MGEDLFKLYWSDDEDEAEETNDQAYKKNNQVGRYGNAYITKRMDELSTHAGLDDENTALLQHSSSS